VRLQIVACFYPPSTGTTTGTPSPTTTPWSTGTPSATTTPFSTGTPSPTTTLLSTGTPLPTTTTLQPTTTTMNYCIQENGMNQPLTIQPNQVTSYPPYDQTTPQGDINPTSTTPGLNFSSPNPQINVILTQTASLTVIYIPTDRPNQPTNVDQFAVVFVYPNGTTSPSFTSQIPSVSGTTTTTTTPAPSTGVPSGTSTTPIPSGIVPPSDVSPQVDLPPNFQVPNGTTVVLNIKSTTDDSPPTGVCSIFILKFFKMIDISVVVT
jgi:hypothetical protein